MKLDRHFYVLSVLACALLCAMPAVAERRPTPSLIGLAVSLACLPFAAKLDRFMARRLSAPERPRYERPEDDPNLYVKAVVRRDPEPERPTMFLVLNENEVLDAAIAHVEKTHGLKIDAAASELLAYHADGEHTSSGSVEVKLGVRAQAVEPAAETQPSA